MPVNLVVTRGGPFLNLLAPVAFYWLATLLLPRRAALYALGAFLFAHPFASWQSATYSPWLFVANFAQGLFYLTVAVWIRTGHPAPVTHGVAVGVLVGLTFLAHTAPALLFGVLVLVWVLTRFLASPADGLRAFGSAAVIGAVAAVVASPFLWVILGHYRGQVLNTLPILWLDPAMLPPYIGAFLRELAGPAAVSVLALVGFVLVARNKAGGGNPHARLVIMTWTLAALTLFAFSAYAWRAIDAPVMQRLALVPAHHFLFYFRAAVALTFGAGLYFLLGLSRTHLVPRLPRGAPFYNAAAAILAAVIFVGIIFPNYLRRPDVALFPKHAAAKFTDGSQRDAFEWIATQSPRDAVFLTSDSAAFSMVGPAGRHVVVVERFFSNPYVSWTFRDAVRRGLWSSLTENNCRGLSAYQRALDVSHVMVVQGSTPPVENGRCGADEVFRAGDFSILRLPAHGPR